MAFGLASDGSPAFGVLDMRSLLDKLKYWRQRRHQSKIAHNNSLKLTALMKTGDTTKEMDAVATLLLM